MVPLFEDKTAENTMSFDELYNSTRSSMVTIFRVAFKSQVNSIFKYGYNRAFTGTEGGNAYGPGVYCTFRLDDTIYNCKTKPEYGNCIIEMRLLGGFNGFIIFDERLAKQTYGKNWTISRQLETVAGFSRYEAMGFENWVTRTEGDIYHGRTAGAAITLWHKYDQSIFKKHGVRGLIYKGNRDGHCALPYDFSAVIPFAVSTDLGKTFQKKITKESYEYLVNHPDIEFNIGGKFEKVHGSVLGYSIAQNKSGKYNVVNGKTGEPLSDIWFDDIQGHINPSNGTFVFTAGGYSFIASIFGPDGNSKTGCILDLYKQPYCPFSELGNLIEYMRENGIRDFKHLMEIEAESEDDGDEELMESIVSRVVRSILEDRTVSNDGVVTVDNFEKVKQHMSPDSEDDVWFVKLVKRHKDNPHLPKNGKSCDHYITYCLLHNANELSEKENEIKELCKKHNARAYINMDKRSLVKLTDYANNVLKPRFRRHNAKEYIGHEIEVAAGQAKDQGFPERKLCFLDIDTDDTRVYNKVMSILDKAGIKPLWEYRSLNNGWHIVLPDKEQARGLDFSSIDRGYDFGRFSTVGIEIDKPILLYASLRPKGYGVQQRVQMHKRNKQRHR